MLFGANWYNMTNNVKSLLKKADLFERLAIYGGSRAFTSIAQDTNAFNNVKKYLELAKDSLRDDLFNLIGPAWSTWYASIKNGLFRAPQSITEAEEQINTLKKIKSAFFKNKNEDLSGKLENAVTTLHTYVSGATTELQKVKDFESGLMNSSVNSSIPETGATAWTGKVPTTISPSVQHALNTLLGSNLEADGSLGPQTATALQLYKDKYNNIKHIFDPTLHKDIVQKAKDKKMGIISEVPF